MTDDEMCNKVIACSVKGEGFDTLVAQLNLIEDVGLLEKLLAILKGRGGFARKLIDVIKKRLGQIKPPKKSQHKFF